jgi:hypothetical protein
MNPMRQSHFLRNPKRHAHYASGVTLSSHKMAAMAKRNLQLNIRMSDDDLTLLRKAAAALWVGIPVTDSTLILSLAKLKAEEVLRAKAKK